MEVIDPRTTEERNWAMFCHLAALAGYIIPFGNIIGPLIIWVLKREESSFVDFHGKAAVNFQISMTLYLILAAMLIILLIGIFMLIALGVLNLILVIIASVRANSGEYFEYPLSIRFIQ
ncbi:MAG TPA: DUF4870 domain-containing protein [Bacteroidetes bacterium]|nr:DUF4870 domain-containing protein [Bacteroidota bacterium]